MEPLLQGKEIRTGFHTLPTGEQSGTPALASSPYEQKGGAHGDFTHCSAAERADLRRGQPIPWEQRLNKEINEATGGLRMVEPRVDKGGHGPPVANGQGTANR